MLTLEVLNCLKAKQHWSLVENSLANHGIEETFRSKMVDWMVEVITKFELDLKTFFLSVKLLDRFLQLTTSSFSNNYLLLLGVTCMFIASKLEDVGNYNINVFAKQIAHNKISCQEITTMETQILITLAFDIDFVVCTDFLGIICKAFSIPETVKRTAENILVLVQMFYNLGFVPALEAACGLAIASQILGFTLNSDAVYALYCEGDFLNRVWVMQQFLGGFNEKMQKFRSAMVFRKFELVVNSAGISMVST